MVGYVERCEIPESDDDEQTFWREYLLYHRDARLRLPGRRRGRLELGDADHRRAASVSGDSARHDGVRYQQALRLHRPGHLRARRVLLALTRDQRTANTDYAGTGTASAKRLNRERDEGDGTQRGGLVGRRDARRRRRGRQPSGSAPDKRAALQRDAAARPPRAAPSLLAKIVFWGFVVVVVLVMFRCGGGGGDATAATLRNTFGEASQEYQSCLNSQRSGSGYRTGGGSFGGFSSGGGHK